MHDEKLYEYVNEQKELGLLRELNHEIALKVNKLKTEEEWFKHRRNKSTSEKDRAINYLEQLCKVIEIEYSKEQESLETEIDILYKKLFSELI